MTTNPHSAFCAPPKNLSELRGAYLVLIVLGLMELTRIPLGPSSHAMLRVIWSTADFDVLYAAHAKPYEGGV